jgi:hypothetical protein
MKHNTKRLTVQSFVVLFLSSCTTFNRPPKGSVATYPRAYAAGCYAVSASDLEISFELPSIIRLLPQPFEETVGTSWEGGLLVVEAFGGDAFAVHPRVLSSGDCVPLYWLQMSVDSILIAWPHPPAGHVARLFRRSDGYAGKLTAGSDVLGRADTVLGTVRLTPVACDSSAPAKLGPPAPTECRF